MRVLRRIGLACVLGAVVLWVWPLAACATHRTPPALDASAPQQESSVDARLDSYPLATRLHLRLVSGERVDGVLLSVDEESITVEVHHDEPAREIARASIAEVSSYTTAVRKVVDTISVTVGLTLLVLLILFIWSDLTQVD